MEAKRLIEYPRGNNFTVKADGDYLELSPSEKVTDELINRLRKYKPAIVNGNITGSLLEVFRSLSHQNTGYLSHVSWYLTHTSAHLWHSKSHACWFFIMG
ncbi:hypothetical protein [Nitrosomonas ureae]|uniref:TubC N-terminal docking domain-containing protein n=1 Tax=Nitrosomonas ureae TaxID=44577 RepID=A0A1H5V5P0_9PROT|nr:hypothetical protein [Nitrosomonas ureae]SEF82732.1 hypothetical protein SAMN05216334_11130 [Nitrosomonas ureae]